MIAQLQKGVLFANRFEIDRTAGAGGMGVVYRARDCLTGQIVALKVLNSAGADPQEGARFGREVQILAELRHPGIVSYLCHGQSASGQSYLAMEWLEGEDLNQRLKRGPLSLQEACLLLGRTAAALALAHERGIVHRDVNPSNLFLPGGDLGSVKLLDFGIARRSTNPVTHTGLVIGTPEYMAPEQVRGQRELLPAADIFSLGCVFYKCLTGKPAFGAEQIAALLVRILFEEPVPLRERLPTVPESIVGLLRRMLQKDPVHRFADAGELVVALASLGDLPALAPAVMDAPPPSPFANHEQVLYTLVVASLAPAEEAARPTESVVQPERELVSALRTLGVRADFVVGGLLVVTIPPRDSATDQVALAARVALLIKERWPGATVAVATGRGAAHSGATVGEVVDRATGMLRSEMPPADPGSTGVYLDELSARLVAGRFEVLAVSATARLLGEAKDADASRPLLGKPTPCVGRDAELAVLESQLLSCIEDSEARAVIITAAPGIGKSRLRHEFLRRIEKLETHPAVWLARGDLMGTSSPYGILGDALRRLSGLTGSEPPEVQRRKLRERIGQHLWTKARADAERVVLFLGELCGLPFPEEENPMLVAARQDPKILRDRIRRAFLDWLTAECAVAPVLLVIDDLHFGDGLSAALIDEALRELSGAPLCVLAFARPELYQTLPRLWHGHKLQEIQLKGLARRPCERLVQQMLGKQVAPAVIARIVEQSAGNALFLEELIRATAEGKTDSHAETVVAMLQARIGQLEAGPRRVVRAAAVFGQTFWRGGVAKLLGCGPEAPELRSWLAALVGAEVIEPHAATRLAAEEEYGFRHGLVRDAAYGLLTPEDLLTGHRLAAEFLVAAGARAPALIADHYERGGDRAAAARFYARAAEQALSSADSQSALQHVARGLSCDADAETLALLRSVEVAAWRRLNRFDRLYELIPTALPLLRAGTRAWSRTLSVAVLAATLGPPAWRAKVPELIQMLLGAAPEPDARVPYAEALAFMALALAAVAPRAVIQPVLGRLQSVVELKAEHDPTFRRWYLLPYYQNVHYREPRPYSTLIGAEEGIALARVAGDRLIHVSLSITQRACKFFELGDIPAALRTLRETEKEAAQVDGFVSELTRQTLARVLCESDEPGALDQAVRYGQAAIDSPGSASMFVGMAHNTLARVQLKRNQPAVSEATLAYKALEAAPLHSVEPAATLVWSLLASSTPAEALPVAEKALAVIAAYGGAGYAEVELRLAASTAFHAAGALARAHAELRATLEQIRLRADDIVDPVWRRSYLCLNPHCATALRLAAEWGLAETSAGA